QAIIRRWSDMAWTRTTCAKTWNKDLLPFGHHAKKKQRDIRVWVPTSPCDPENSSAIGVHPESGAIFSTCDENLTAVLSMHKNRRSGEIYVRTDFLQARAIGQGPTSIHLANGCPAIPGVLCTGLRAPFHFTCLIINSENCIAILISR